MKTRSGQTLRQQLDRMVDKEERESSSDHTAVGAIDEPTFRRLMDAALCGTAADYITGGVLPDEPELIPDSGEKRRRPLFRRKTGQKDWRAKALQALHKRRG